MAIGNLGSRGDRPSSCLPEAAAAFAKHLLAVGNLPVAKMRPAGGSKFPPCMLSSDEGATACVKRFALPLLLAAAAHILLTTLTVSSRGTNSRF